MVARLDTVVVGGGAMGSATAWALAGRGREVTLLEQFEPGHKLGASHGTTRNLNLGYSDPTYVAMLSEALDLWTLLGQQCGTEQVTRTGTVNHGDPAAQAKTLQVLTEAGIRAEELSAAEAGERWRGIRFDGPALHMPDGGQLNPDLALPSFQRVAERPERTSGTVFAWSNCGCSPMMRCVWCSNRLQEPKPFMHEAS